MNSFITFINSNWVNLLLILVGTFALLVYWLQERRKETEAASLIILQVDELQEKLKEIRSYINNSQLNDTAFYESQVLFVENCWNKYKHYFVRKMDVKSYQTINLLYSYAAEIQEQQQLMKNLQKNFFFVKQQALTNVEINYIISGIEQSKNNAIDMNQISTAFMQTMPETFSPEQKNAFTSMIQQVNNNNSNINFTTFWNVYNKNRSDIVNIIDQNGLTAYIPVQIRLSLEKALNQYALLEITGSDGYKILQKIAKRKF